MKKNNVLITVLAVILIAVCGAVAFLAVGQRDFRQTTTESQTADDTTASLAGSVFNTTKKKTTTKKTTQSTTQDKNAFIRKGVWYLADIDNETCIAFAFGKNGKADIAFFNSDNIEGFDAQYFKGDGVYEIRKDKIIFSKLPKATGMKSIELKIKNNKLYYGSKKLKNYKKISLDYALKCFE